MNHPAGRAPRVVLLAAKNLTYNTRVHRQAASLARAGWRVTVAALAPPVATLRAQAPEVDYLTVTLPHPLQALRRRFRRGAAEPANAPGTTDASAASPRADGVALRAVRALVLPWADLITRKLFARACVQVLGDRRFDVVQAHDSPALRAAFAVAGRSGAPVVYDGVEAVEGRATFARGRLARALRKLESWLEARMIRRADLVLTIGPGLGAWMQARYRIAMPRVLRNCREWQPACDDRRLREACALGVEERLVLSANSIVPDAGIEQLIDALPLLPASVHLALLGPVRDAAYRRALEAHAAARGVGARLHFPPPCAADEVVAMFAGADVGVIALQNTRQNHYLALPNRLFEMIMARLPLVVADLPDLAGVVMAFELGERCDERDSRSLAAALARVLEPQRHAALRAHLEIAASTLNWEREAHDYDGWLRALLPAHANH